MVFRQHQYLKNISETRDFLDSWQWHAVCDALAQVDSKWRSLTFEKILESGTEMLYPRRLLLLLVISAGAVFGIEVFPNGLSAFSPPVQLSQSPQLSRGFFASQPDSIDTWISLKTITAAHAWQWTVDFTQVHPFVWAGIVLFAVLIAMIWASSEWEIARLFSNDTANSVHPKK